MATNNDEGVLSMKIDPVIASVTTAITKPTIIASNSDILADLDSEEEDDLLDYGDEDEDSTTTPDSDTETSLEEVLESGEGNVMIESFRYKNLLISSDPLADESSIIRVLEEDGDSDDFSLFRTVNDLYEEDDLDDEDEEGEGDQSDDEDYTEDEDESENEAQDNAENSNKRKLEVVDSEDDTLEDTDDEHENKKPKMMDKVQELTEYYKSNSKIPIPIRRSKKSQHITCNPVLPSVELPLISAIKSYEAPILNLFIDSSTGALSEATRFATEINAFNGVGVPLPKSVNEVVTIPVNNKRRANKQKKIAFVKGMTFNHTEKKQQRTSLGFYTPEELRKYLESQNCEEAEEPKKEGREQESPKAKVTKKLRWASQLEW